MSFVGDIIQHIAKMLKRNYRFSQQAEKQKCEMVILVEETK